MKLFVVRHGETTGDVENRYGGTYDDHLSPRGLEQARALAAMLSEKGIQMMYVSPLLRAQETAAVLAHACGCAMETAADLRERNQYSFLSGMEKGEAAEKYPHEVELLKNRLSTIDGAEKYEDFSARISGVLASLAGDSRYETITLVTHGGPLRVLFRDILRRGELSAVGDCAWAEVEAAHGAYTLTALEGITERIV